MALDSDMELLELLWPSQAASLHVSDLSSSELCDRPNAFNFMKTNIKTCKYLDPHHNQSTIDNNHSFILLHLNIRSLHKNFDSFYEFLLTLNFTPDIICITETRLKDQPLININLPNYTFLHENFMLAAGGVAVCVSTRLNCNLCPVQHQLTTAECLRLNVSEKNSNSKFIVGIVNRHPV